MPKRFTETDKWTDKWFRRLPADQKLAYLYILDRCDMAGTIEIDEELAEFQMGCPTDWEGLVKGSGTRLVPLPNGRIWVSKFIGFQHGKLSEACNAHKSALSLIQKYSLPISNENKGKRTKGTARVKEPLAKGPGNSNGNSNGNSKKKGGVGENNGDWLVPENLDTPEVRELLKRFEIKRLEIKKPIKNLADASLVLKRFDSPEHLAYALEFCIANGYQGLKPEYRPTGTNGQPSIKEIAW
jgi:hypothetical protein